MGHATIAQRIPNCRQNLAFNNNFDDVIACLPKTLSKHLLRVNSMLVSLFDLMFDNHQIRCTATHIHTRDTECVPFLPIPLFANDRKKIAGIPTKFLSYLVIEIYEMGAGRFVPIELQIRLSVV